MVSGRTKRRLVFPNQSKNPGPTVTRAVAGGAIRRGGGAWLNHIVLATQDLDSPATLRGLTAYPALNPCREAPCAGKSSKK
eukprot:7355177-Prymnesium_polylepis.1